MVDIDPPITSYSPESVFNEDGTAIGVLNDLYVRLVSGTFQSQALSSVSISIKASLSADELTLWSGGDEENMGFYQNNLISRPTAAGGSRGVGLWRLAYSGIYKCNAAIEGLNASKSLSPAIKQQLLGEAYFMRAFYHLYINELYGDAAIVTTTDHKINSTVSRSPITAVYQFMVADLKKAQELLSREYLDGKLKPFSSGIQKVRPTYWAATALLARVYLYAGDYTNANDEATKVLTQSSLFTLTPTPNINNVFNSNNNLEAIWQLQPVNTNGATPWNTEEGKIFKLPAPPQGINSSHPVYLSQFLLSAFEAGDNRRSNWIGTYSDGTGTFYFPNKYKAGTASNPVTEFSMVLRLAELYLIRAEALAQLNNIAGAQADLNKIRERAGLTQTTASDKGALLTAILQERRVELFTEWGHRWIDLRRFNAIDAIMATVTPAKAPGTAWQSFRQRYPLPFDDIERNPHLVQNAGY